MPLYEYQCDACGDRFERIQKFSDPLATACPKCAGTVRKLVSSPAIQFKGTGWYVTDYAKKGTPDTEASVASSDGEKAKPAKTDKSATSTSGDATSSSGSSKKTSESSTNKSSSTS